MKLYPYNNTNIIKNLFYNIYMNSSNNIIGITGNKNDGMCYISTYIEKTYKFTKLDFEKDNINKIQDNKNYVINNLTKYIQYTDLIHYNPIIIRIDDYDIKDDNNNEYKYIPYNIYLLNSKNKQNLIKQLKYKI